jgi:hypothetical protein
MKFVRRWTYRSVLLLKRSLVRLANLDAAVFATSEAFFARADELLAELAAIVKDMPNCHIVREHKLNFNAHSVGERARLSYCFFRMTASMVFKGHSRLIFKRRDGKDAAAKVPDQKV